jgi:hypothetical protein
VFDLVRIVEEYAVSAFDKHDLLVDTGKYLHHPEIDREVGFPMLVLKTTPKFIHVVGTGFPKQYAARRKVRYDEEGAFITEDYGMQNRKPLLRVWRKVETTGPLTTKVVEGLFDPEEVQKTVEENPRNHLPTRCVRAIRSWGVKIE